MKNFLSGTIFATVLMFAGPALSADLAARPAPALPTPTTYDWSGLYIGGHVGYAWSTTTFADPSATAVLTNCCSGPGITGAAATNANPNAFLGGVQAGWMYQVARLVIGGDFDWSAMKMHGTGAAPFNDVAPFSETETFGIKTKWTGTVTTTVGVARDRLMLYAKAGAAFAENTYSQGVGGFGFVAGPFTITSPNVNKIVAGWTVGTGVKWAFADNWFVNLEYNYLDFGSKAQNFAGQCNFIVGPCGTVTFNPTFNQHVSQVELGLNYKFNTGPGGFLFW